MDNERDRDDLDRAGSPTDEEARGFEDEDFEEADDVEDQNVDDEFDPNEEPTKEVGSEGGSPGDTVATRRQGEQVRGSEKSETWSPEQDESKTVERVGDEGQPRRRNP